MDQDKPRFDELETAHLQLRAGLEQCRAMVADYRSLLAPDGGRPPEPDASQGDSAADPAG